MTTQTASARIPQRRPPSPFLPENVLAQCARRAPEYDRDARFFTEDFAELRDAGYLTMAVPQELGGAGLSLAAAMQEQRRLGYHAAPTALAMNKIGRAHV